MMSQFPWLEYIALLSAFGIAAIVPGPDFAVVLRQSIVFGRKTAIYTSLGVALAILVHGTYTILGLGFIISQSLFLFSAIKVIGALYLLWLGISIMRAPAPVKPNFDDGKSNEAYGIGKAFIVGFLTNLLNPKAMLFFLALFSTIISASTAIEHKAFFVFSMSVELFIWYVCVSIFFTTPTIRGAFYKIGKWFNRIAGLALLALAVRVAFSKP